MITPELEKTFNLAVHEAEARRHDLVCLEHILLAMLDDAKAGDILQSCGADLARLRAGLVDHLDGVQKVPEGRKLDLEKTMAVTRVLRRAAIHVQSAGKKEIDAGDVLAAMFREQDCQAVYLMQQQGLSRFDIIDYISHGVAKTSGESAAAKERDGDDDDAGGERGRGRTGALERYTVNLVAKAAAGQIDPLIGRADELQRTLHVLCRRRKNNPIFVGEPGVGKTAIAEGLALAIHGKQVPSLLAEAEVFALDMGNLIAGTKFRGEFEQRLKAVVAAIHARKHAILFIDEIHTIVGAGAVSGGTLDASNILKPALADGSLRCMGSTTSKEYQATFERDRALARRFQKIEVKQPSVDEAVRIARGVIKLYEAFHGVNYTDRSLRAACELAHKFLTDRQLPDSAIDVLDEAGAALRLQPASRRNKSIRAKDVEQIVSKIARVPTVSVSTSDKERLHRLAGDLKLVIYGQDHAIDEVVAAIKVARAGLGNPRRPVGTFVFAGPTGVGKTELSRQLAKSLGVELLRFDMSEYMEKHTISRLIGAPPGYVGHDQGGLLTDAVIKNPHAVLVLDEIEKAHPDLFNILLQVMDYATLTDSNGRRADFRNVILIMTTNAGAREMEVGSMGFARDQDAADNKRSIERTFSPEIRNRFDAIITFSYLSREVIDQVVDKAIVELEAQLEAKRVSLDLSVGARRYLAAHGYDRKRGARPIRRLIDVQIRRRLADEILGGQLKEGGHLHVDCDDDALHLTFTARAGAAGACEPLHHG